MGWRAGSTPCWPTIDPLAPHDGWALALNNAHAVELSWLDAPRFGELVQHAFLACRIADRAFLLAFDQPDTTARTSCGFAHATADSSMSTVSS